MKTLKMEDVEVGMLVVFVDRGLNREDAHVQSDRASVPLDGREGMVVATSDQPGKRITVVLKEPHDNAHTCDGFAPENHGVWAMPEHLYRPEDHIAHKETSEKSRRRDQARNDQKVRARAAAMKYLGKAETATTTPEKK